MLLKDKVALVTGSTHNIGLAMGEALAHLHCLEADGRVQRQRDDDGVWRFSAID